MDNGLANIPGTPVNVVVSIDSATLTKHGMAVGEFALAVESGFRRLAHPESGAPIFCPWGCVTVLSTLPKNLFRGADASASSLKVAVDVDGTVLDRSGISIEHFAQAIETSLANLGHPETGIPFACGKASVIILADLPEISLRRVDEVPA